MSSKDVMFGPFDKLTGERQLELPFSCVLVIEDSAMDRAFIQKVLQQRGYHVLTAQNSRQGIALAGRGNWDVIILDYCLPDMNGLEVYRALKGNKTTRNIPVIFLTIVQDGFTMLECFEAGADAFLSKPISAKELIQQVEWVLQDREDQYSSD